MKKTITLKASYATTNTVRFDEVVNGNGATHDFLAATSKPEGALGSAMTQYLTGEQLSALDWKPTSVGEQYVADGARGKTYTRRDVAGPDIKLTLEVA